MHYMYSVTCLIWHTGGPEKNVGLGRLLEYSGFFCKDRHILGPWKNESVKAGCWNNQVSDLAGYTVLSKILKIKYSISSFMKIN